MTLVELLNSFSEEKPIYITNPKIINYGLEDSSNNKTENINEEDKDPFEDFQKILGLKDIIGITPKTSEIKSDEYEDFLINAPKISTKLNKKQTLPKKTIDRAKFWMDQFAKYGFNTTQQIAIVAAMMGECALNPKKAVEKKELAGKGNTKAGWAHAGEGTVGFTHWALKKHLIQQFNAHPNRKGDPLSTIESVYAKPESKHISDLSDEDQALITYLFYKDRLKATQNFSFEDIVADFYIQKAGVGYRTKWGTKLSMSERALKAGQEYQKAHRKLGYYKAARTNTFIKTLDTAKALANQLGYTV